MKFAKKAAIITTATTIFTLAAAQEAVAQTGYQPATNDNATYDFVGVQYLWQEWNDCEQDGLQVNGSLSFSERLYATAAVSDVDGDYCGSTATSIGLGYHAPMNNTFDWYASLSYINIDWGPGDDTGLGAEGGIRGYIGERLESRVSLRHTTTDDGETSIGAGLSYWFSPRLAATVDASAGGDTTSFLLGAQYAF